MPLPFPDFAEPVVAQRLTLNVLPYAEYEALTLEGTIIGETALAAGEVATVAALAEPLIIIGAGLLAAAAAEEILKKLSPQSVPPKLAPRLPSGGRVGGGSFARVKQNLNPYGPETNNYPFGGILIGIGVAATFNGAVSYYLDTTAGRVPISESLPANYVETPTIIEYHYNVNAPINTPQIGQPLSQPGNLVLPVPQPRTITRPGEEPIVITPRAVPSPRNFPGIKPFSPVSPGILVVVPEIGIAFNFNPTEVQIIYFNPSPSETENPAPNAVVAPYNPIKDNCECPPVDTAEILCRIKAIQDGVLDDGYISTTHQGVTGEGEIVASLPDELYAVSITISQFPSNLRHQEPGGNAPKVYFAGWFSWVVNGKPTERFQINYLNNGYAAPKAATGYSYTVYSGCVATAIAVTRKKKPYVNAC